MSTDPLILFTRIVAESFQALCKEPNVFIADVEGDELYAKYLASFPEGTDPFYKNEHRTRLWYL